MGAQRSVRQGTDGIPIHPPSGVISTQGFQHTLLLQPYPPYHRAGGISCSNQHWQAACRTLERLARRRVRLGVGLCPASFGNKDRKVSTVMKPNLLVYTESQNHRITESQNSRGWKGRLWVI